MELMQVKFAALRSCLKTYFCNAIMNAEIKKSIADKALVNSTKA